VLLTGIVDYAGLFPPAALAMEPAVHEYAAYLADPHRFMLGRFVVPVARLPEFERAVVGLLPVGPDAAPWQLTALAGPDVEADLELVRQFNARHDATSSQGRAEVDALEIKASSTAEIASAMSRMPSEIEAFFEVPVDPDPAPLLGEIRRSGGKAKIRTGGITTEAFPTPAAVTRFIVGCATQGVGFKATAGLHHPIRGEYRLTYEPVPPVGTMYGYLNVFLSAAFARTGNDAEWIERVLTERDPKAFVFSDAAVTYDGRTIPVEALSATRDTFAVSFGSCSFREPVDDLLALHLL